MGFRGVGGSGAGRRRRGDGWPVCVVGRGFRRALPRPPAIKGRAQAARFASLQRRRRSSARRHGARPGAARGRRFMAIWWRQAPIAPVPAPGRARRPSTPRPPSTRTTGGRRHRHRRPMPTATLRRRWKAAPRRPPGKRGIVILQIGDSHTSADFLTGELRRRLQARYGRGAPGYITAGRPHIGVRTSSLSHEGLGRLELQVAAAARCASPRSSGSPATTRSPPPRRES